MTKLTKREPATYKNRKGQLIDRKTHKVVLTSIEQYNRVRQDKAITRNRKMNIHYLTTEASIYTGLKAAENWDNFFDYLRTKPLELSKACSSVGFTLTGMRSVMGKDKALKERYDDIMSEELDNLETNLRDIAYEPDKKYISTKMQAIRTLLEARAKERGYGQKHGINIEGGSIQLNVINMTGVPLPGHTKELEDIDHIDVTETEKTEG